MTETAIPDRPWYPALDGIRGIAIIGILLAHNFDFIPFSAYGRTGVDLFFVLSGFLITDILLRTRNHPHYLKNYFVRRVLRIFPLYYGFVILFFLLVRYLPVLQDQSQYYHEHAAYVWLHLQNWLYLLHEKPVSPAPLMNHFWSLSLEEQFYLLWPVVIFFFRKSVHLEKLLLLFLFLSMTARLIGWEYWGDGYRYFYFQSVARLDGFAVGGLLASWKYSHTNSLRKLIRLIIFLTFAEVLFGVLSYEYSAGLPHTIITGISLLAALFGLLVHSGISARPNVLQRWLSVPWLRWFGKYAYGIYVYHWPLLVLSKIYLLPRLQQWHVPAIMTSSLYAIIVTLLTLVISAASYRYLEKRFLDLKTRYAN